MAPRLTSLSGAFHTPGHPLPGDEAGADQAETTLSSLLPRFPELCPINHSHKDLRSGFARRNPTPTPGSRSLGDLRGGWHQSGSSYLPRPWSGLPTLHLVRQRFDSRGQETSPATRSRKGPVSIPGCSQAGREGWPAGVPRTPGLGRERTVHRQGSSLTFPRFILDSTPAFERKKVIVQRGSWACLLPREGGASCLTVSPKPLMIWGH